MDLARLQAAVARLAVDEALRETFLNESARAADALGLSVAEAAELARRVEGLAPFADSLIRKRLGAVRRLLPETARRMGVRFDEEFRRFAAARASQGPGRHERDAVELAAILKAEVAGGDLEVLLIEAGWIEAQAGRRLLLRRLQRGYAVWFRLGRSVRFWRIGRGVRWTGAAPAAQESEESH